MDWLKLAAEKFQIEAFKDGQLEALERLEEGKDCLAILPTGGGKSLIYQLYQAAGEGTTVIVSPLLALMEDQVDQLRRRGFKKILALNSQYRPSERAELLKLCRQMSFILLSPEMLCQPAVLKHLKALDIRLFVVDEAHCISQWGISFRPEYAKLKQQLDYLSKPQILALTATANERVVLDIKRHLFFKDRPSSTVIAPMNRRNLYYDRLYVKQEQKEEKLAHILLHLPKPGILYVHHKAEIQKLQARLKQLCPQLSVMAYHGDMHADERLAVQAQFQAGQIDVILATSAFGMGIHHDFIRFILHYHLPQSLGEYVQEVGRAGRDGQHAYCLMLIDENEAMRLHYLKEERCMPLATFSRLYHSLQAISEKQQAAKIQEKLAISLEQANILAYFLSHYPEEKAAQAAYQKYLDEELRAFRQVEQLMSQPHCLRHFLLSEFSGERIEAQTWCCCNCKKVSELGEEWQQYMSLAKERKASPILTLKGSAWARLAKLFNQRAISGVDSEVDRTGK